MKTILITGSNKGIGYETARQLLRMGHRVILSGRDEVKIRAAAASLEKEGGEVQLVTMDVSAPESVQSAAAILQKQQVRLDVLINNAGIVHRADRDLSADNEDVLLTTLATNSLGPLRVVRALLPMLNAGGRIINISSEGGSMTDPVGGWSPAYCVSKSLLNAMARHLAYELEDRKITVNAICPGWVKTDMGGKSAPRSVERGAETLVWMATANSVPTGMFFRDKKVIPW